MTTTRPRRRILHATIAATAMAAAVYASTPLLALTNNNWSGVNGSYNVAGNWNNNNVPISTDQAYIYSGTVTMTANSPAAGGIFVGKFINTPSLNTAGFKLTCCGTVQVDSGAVLFLGAANAGASLQTSSLTITNGSIADMYSASAVLNATNAISIDGPSTLDVQGTANATNAFNENGTLSAVGTGTINTGTFTFAGNSSNTANILLNGNSLAINASTFSMGNLYTNIDLSAAGSHLTLNSTAFGAPIVNAAITLGNSSHLSLPGSAEFLLGNIVSGITAGSVTLNGGTTAATAAVVDNYAFYESVVNVNGFASMPGSAEFDGGSVTTINPNSTLTVNAPYFRGVPHNSLFGGGTDNYSNVTFNGNGTLNWTGGSTGIGYNASNISTAVFVNTPTFNWEGTSATSNASIDIQNGELDIYSTSLQNRLVYNGFFFVPTNGYDGTMNVEGGAKLNVANAAWTMYGSLTLGPGAVVQGQTLTFNGSSLPPGNYSLYPSFSGSNFPSIQAPTVFGANAVVYMGFQGGLHLDGNTTWAGGTLISAPYVQSPYGVVVQNGNATVTANTTLFCSTYDMDGSANNATWNINANVTLTQQAWYIDPTDGTNNPFHGTINLAGTLDMETQAGKWTLAGGTLNVTGNGSNSAIVQHDKLVLGLGSTIGTIHVLAGGNGFIFGGLESAATTVSGGNVINLDGYLVMDSTLTFDANSVTTEIGTFAFEVNTSPICGVGSVLNINNGAAQFGSGISGPANLNVNVQGPGYADFYDSTNLNSLHVLAGGNAIISVGGKTFYTNSLTLDGGATPTGSFGITDNKVIVQTSGGKAALLATYRAQVLYGYNHAPFTGIYDYYLPANYGIAVIDNALLGRATFGGVSVNANSILISRELLGDANVDGVVNLADLNIVLSHFGAPTPEWTNGNFDYAPTIDLTDLADVLNNFGLTNPKAFDVAAGSGSIAAPEPTSLASLLLAAPTLLHRRKRGK